MLNHQVVLVTGVSSGIGRETALLLARRGARVFGSVLPGAPEEALSGVELVPLDVTEDESVQAAVQWVLQQAGRIQVLVNNAGYTVAGAVEETSIAEARQQFETNFFGVLRLTQAVLPGMRQQGYGRIVNISSLAGLVPFPFRGLYSASKHALEGYTETLDHEVRYFGIRAILIEPSFTRTQVDIHRQPVQAHLSVYSEQESRVNEAIAQAIAHGDEPGAVAEAVCTAIEAAHPRLRYAVGGGVALSRLRRFAPAAVFDRQFRKQLQLDKAA